MSQTDIFHLKLNAGIFIVSVLTIVLIHGAASAPTRAQDAQTPTPTFLNGNNHCCFPLHSLQMYQIDEKIYVTLMDM